MYYKGQADAERGIAVLVEPSAGLFAGLLMATADVLEPGDIDWGKARIVIGALRRRARMSPAVPPGPVAHDARGLAPGP